MNYASKILDYLAEVEDSLQVLLTPGTVPVAKRGRDLAIVENAILTSQDIRETVSTFAAHAAGSSSSPMNPQGVFSFGMPNRGRFRVRYFTQRGSYVVSIRKVPSSIPDLSRLLPDPAAAQALEDLVVQNAGGILLITGASPEADVQLAYALLKRVNDTAGRVIYVVEPDLTYLLRHHNSVVAQSEVETDVPSIELGIEYGRHMAPDIMYVREARSKTALSALLEVAESGTLVILSLVAFNEKALMADLKARLEDFYANFTGLLRQVVTVAPQADGTISITTSDGPGTTG